MLHTLWEFTRHDHADVRNAAYEALSGFPYDALRYSHLPIKVGYIA